MIEREDIPNHEEPPSKRRNVPVNNSAFKNVARCGICFQWFSDHTTMLMHLQTHSDNYTCKNFTCHICKKSFKEKWQLLRHEVHTDYCKSFIFCSLSCFLMLMSLFKK